MSRFLSLQVRWLHCVVLATLSIRCVSGTVYQRARALQAPNPDADDIAHGLTDPNWKLRCIAAQACRSAYPECTNTVARLATNDENHEVRACALEKLALQCDGRARDLLADVVATILESKSADESPWREGATAGAPVGGGVGARRLAFVLPEAVERCPSPDAILAIASSPTADGRLLDSLDVGPLPLSEPKARLVWLERVRSFAGRATTTDKLLAYTKATVEDEAKREQERRHREAAEAKARAESNAREGAAARSLAESLIASNPAEALEHVEHAERLGVDVRELKERIANACKAAGEGHLVLARRALKGGQLEKAETERELAAHLGVSDDDLVAAINLAVERQRERETVKEWSKFVARCAQVRRDRAALDSVLSCNGNCQKAQVAIEKAWDTLTRPPFPPTPASPAAAARVKALCEREGCPSCPE